MAEEAEEKETSKPKIPSDDGSTKRFCRLMETMIPGLGGKKMKEKKSSKDTKPKLPPVNKAGSGGEKKPEKPKSVVQKPPDGPGWFERNKPRLLWTWNYVLPWTFAAACLVVLYIVFSGVWTGYHQPATVEQQEPAATAEEKPSPHGQSTEMSPGDISDWVQKLMQSYAELVSQNEMQGEAISAINQRVKIVEQRLNNQRSVPVVAPPQAPPPEPEPAPDLTETGKVPLIKAPPERRSRAQSNGAGDFYPSKSRVRRYDESQLTEAERRVLLERR
ncbi:MAG: hypothetical protein Q8Q06_03235 [bacterium]|nr:hypothetical protein [bacterium]